jgi:hypothetical protein
MAMVKGQKGLLLACGAALLLATTVLSGDRPPSDPGDAGKISIGNTHLICGKGKGPGNGTGNGGSGPKDGSGYGPGKCTTFISTIDPESLLAGNGTGLRGRQSNGSRKGPGNGTGTCINS